MARVDIMQDMWGIRGRAHDYAICAAAFLAAQQLFGRHSQAEGPFEALAKVGSALHGRDIYDGAGLAKAWLLDLPVDRLDESLLQHMSAAVCRDIDPRHTPTKIVVADQILSELIGYDGRSTAVLPALAGFMITVSAVQDGDTIACAFPQAAHLALRLAATNSVRFLAGDESVAIASALLAIGTQHKLSVDVRDPLTRASFGTRRSTEHGWSPSEVDHLFALPPLGHRYDLEDGRGSRPAELLQFEDLSGHWSKTMMTVVTDGFLHRSAGAERRIREDILRRSSPMVISLPTGACGPGPAANTTLLGLRREDPEAVNFYDGRSLRMSGARATQRQLVEHFKVLAELLENDPERHRNVKIEEVQGACNLSVDRYFQSKIQTLEGPYRRPPPMRLDIAADVIRPQAAKTVGGHPASFFEALELGTGDIIDGSVMRPTRLVRFAQADRNRVLKSVVRAHDIILCVKGKVGLVGLVPLIGDDDLPWVISQSFAIIRPRDEPGSDLAVVLAAMLTAPWATEKFQALAGGTSVRMLQMEDVRSFEIPMPFGWEERDALMMIRENGALQQTASRLRQDILRNQQKIWMTLWGRSCPPE